MSENLTQTNFVQDNELSDTLASLTTNYLKYGAVVVTDRAIPAIDGLKPSGRRILYTMNIEKIYSLIKCNDIIGMVTRYHPHEMPYGPLVDMVPDRCALAYTPVTGKGSFGYSFNDDQPAAPRYTNACLDRELADYWFGDMAGVEMVPAYDGVKREPALLPVKFPTVLCNGTTGMAVGMATNIPSFNLDDVIQATIEYIQTGTTSLLIKPDFPSGGVWIYDEDVLKNILNKGKGTLRFRAAYEIEGNEIIFTEMPPRVKLDSTLIGKIKELKLDGIREIRDESDKVNLCRLVIECRSKSKVDEVLLQIMNKTALTTTLSVNLNLIIDRTPKVCGVYEVIKHWVDFRKQVLTKQLNVDLINLQAQYKKVGILLKVMQKEVLNEYIDGLKISETHGKNVITRVAPEATDEHIEWILDMKMRSLSSIDRRQKEYETLQQRIDQTKLHLADLGSYIISELQGINTRLYKGRYTTIDRTDMFTAAVTDDKPKQDISNYHVVITKDLVVTKYVSRTPDSDKQVYNDTVNNLATILIATTNGECYRCFPSELQAGVQTYLPRYLGVDEFEIAFIEEVLDTNDTTMISYADGYISTFDYSNFRTNKRIKKVANKLPVLTNAIGMSYLADDAYALKATTSKGNIKIRLLTDIIFKSCKAKSKAFPLGKNETITSVETLTELAVAQGIADGTLTNYIL